VPVLAKFDLDNPGGVPGSKTLASARRLTSLVGTGVSTGARAADQRVATWQPASRVGGIADVGAVGHVGDTLVALDLYPHFVAQHVDLARHINGAFGTRGELAPRVVNLAREVGAGLAVVYSRPTTRDGVCHRHGHGRTWRDGRRHHRHAAAVTDDHGACVVGGVAHLPRHQDDAGCRFVGKYELDGTVVPEPHGVVVGFGIDALANHVERAKVVAVIGCDAVG
jgi:hypothetical protein